MPLGSALSVPPRKACTGFELLVSLEHFHVWLDVGCRVVLVRRTPAPFSDSTALVQAFTDFAASIRGLDRSQYCFLGDTRQGPSRNDPAFEEALARCRPLLLGGYRRAATVTSTLAGQMQVRRYAEHDGRTLLVTSSMAEALQHIGLAGHEV